MGHFDVPQIMTSIASQEGEKSVPTTTAKQSLYGKVVINLENVLLPEERLHPTPSGAEGLDKELETELRFYGCELIQTAGILLKLPQVAMATGQILFQRFYYCKSFINHPMEIFAMACIYLASKIEEAPRRIRDVVNVVHHIKQVKAGRTITPVILDYNYVTLKNQIIKAERRVLKELGFCVHVKHPHKIIVMYMQVLEQEKNNRFVQSAWNNMNDALRTDVFVRFQPETIASACIYLAARFLRIPLPSKPHWFEVFSAREKDIQEICLTLMRAYRRGKPDLERIEKVVESLRKMQQEAKLRAKALSGSGTPIPVAPEGFSPDTPLKNSPNHVIAKRDKEDKSLSAKKNSPGSAESSSQLDESASHSPSPISRSNQNRKERKRVNSRCVLLEASLEIVFRSRSRSKSRSVSPETNHKEKKHRKKKRRSRTSSPSPKTKKMRTVLSSHGRNLVDNHHSSSKVKSRHKSRSHSRSLDHSRSHKMHKHKGSSKRSHSREKRK